MQRNTGLQVIFSIFLGLMLAVFLGTGVYSFYPPPEAEAGYSREEPPQREARMPGGAVVEDSTHGDVERFDQSGLETKLAPDYDGVEHTRLRDAWRQRTSIFLIILATLTMVVSLIRPDQLPVMSSGLLLGGVFTMVYGVGWTVSTGLSTGRFAVVTVAFVITLVLGWLRFSRQQGQAGGAPGVSEAPGASGSAGDVAHLEARIRALEERLDHAARGIGGED